MSLFNTIHKRKSAAKTAVIMVLLLLSFFFVGMRYLDPPEEMGIEINFGTSDTGSGDIQPMEPVKSEPQPETPKEVVEETVEETTPDKVEYVITQDSEEDAPVIKPKPKPAETKPKPKPVKPKPDASTSDALNSILNGPSNDGTNSQGEGDDQGSGDKGQIDGNPYANSYFGGGSGTGSGYGLNGRNKTTNQKFTQDCNEEGRVVVKIEVDRQGKVVNAVPGVKGSTNTAACLLTPAKKTALSYRFNSDSKAPNRQIGFIVINFSLGQ